ncbi:MAG: RDD family protein [Pyrinomonadaceae bacterium]
MDTTSARKAAARPDRREVVLGFSPETVQAPFLLRCGALLTDYLLIIVSPVAFLFLGRFFGDDGAALINGDLNNTGWLIAIVLAVADLILLPVVAGQSVGKMLTGLHIVKRDGSPAGFRRILIRQTIGYFFTFVTLGLGFLISALSGSGRSLHDLISGTVVIRGKKEIVN